MLEDFSINLSLYTLTILLVLPFVYFLYQTRYWYHTALTRNFDFFLFLIVAILSTLLALGLSKDKLDTHKIHLAALHFMAAAILIILIIKNRTNMSIPHKVYRNKGEPQKTYTPLAGNKEIEKLSWDDLVLDPEVKKELFSVVELLKAPKTAKKYGISVPKGILLNGPPGTGKTTIAKVIANTAKLSFFSLRLDEVASKYVGESERNLSALFQAASRKAPSVIFIDEADSIGKTRSGGENAWSDNLLNILLQLLDGVVKRENIYIIAATNRADLVDPALKRSGRINKVIDIPLPSTALRKSLFENSLKKIKFGDTVDLEALAKVTDGRSGADIVEICNQAGLNAFKRESKSKDNKKDYKRDYKVTIVDLEAALSEYQISWADGGAGSSGQKHVDNMTAKSVSNQVEKLSWDDVIIDEPVRQELDIVISLLINPEKATQYGITLPKGIILSGPPGNGKTTIAKVIANNANLSFFSLQLDELVSKYVGDSEKNLSNLFESAVKAAPSIIFIDELDSIGQKRSGSYVWADSLLNHLLQLIDGVIQKKGIYIIGATNRPDLIDAALKRSGRLNKIIDIPLPNSESRKKLFELFLSKHSFDEVDLDALAAKTSGKSGADIREICNQAALNTYKRESISDSQEFRITNEDLNSALGEFIETFETSSKSKTGMKHSSNFAVAPTGANVEKLSWDDLIITPALKEELVSVVNLLKDPVTAEMYGLTVPKGTLLYGPPGTGKTTIAKVMSQEAGFPFFALQADEVISKYVGDSEKNLSNLFETAAAHAPSIIFMDEVDSIGKTRSGQHEWADNLLNHLLQLIDGIFRQEKIYIIAATNRPDLVDPALKRSGRLNRMIEIPLPTLELRVRLYNLYLSKVKLGEAFDIGVLAKLTEGLSGADIKEVCNQAAFNAYRRETALGNREYKVMAQDMVQSLEMLYASRYPQRANQNVATSTPSGSTPSE